MSRPHVAAVVEDGWNRWLGSALTDRGWGHLVVPHVGYGGAGFLRILARVLLAPPADPRRPRGHDRLDDQLSRRGWRNFVTTEAMGAEVLVSVTVPGRTVDGRRVRRRTVEHRATTDRSGNLDLRVPNPGLQPGWHDVTLHTERSEQVAARLLVVGDDPGLGIVSDLDDTVIRTYVPRPLLAAYNAFVVTEGARRPVPGMAAMLAEVLERHPGAPTFYVSTGAWNTAPTLGRFLGRHGFPLGPLLLTDWGPTNIGWFRSGAEHKATALRSLAADFPQLTWLLVGDDGQRDPEIYAEFAADRPDRVRAIAIRQLATDEQVLAQSLPRVHARGEVDAEARADPAVPEVRAPDGRGLATGLRGVV